MVAADGEYGNSRLSCVDMAVSSTDGLSNCSFLRALILPGTESDGRDIGTSVEFENRWHGFSTNMLLILYLTWSAEYFCPSVCFQQGPRSY